MKNISVLLLLSEEIQKSRTSKTVCSTFTIQLSSDNVFITYLFTVMSLSWLVEARTSQFAHQQLCNFQAIEALKRMGAQINPFNDNLPINFQSERQTVP